VVAEVRVDDVVAGIDLGRAVGTAIQSRSITSSSIQRVTLVGFPRLREAHDRERGFLEGVRATVPDILALYLDGRAQVSYARRAVRTAHDALSPTDRIAPDVLFGVDDESVIGARQGYADLGTDLANTITATYGISPPSGPRYLDDGTITYGAAMFPEWHGEVLVRLALAALSGQPHEQLVHPPAAVVAASGSPLGWDRFYHLVDQEFELDREAILAIGGSLG
jgi:ABC-type sugar transport system substrate-binding protein